MEGWQICSLLLTINVDNTPGEQQHSGHPLFKKTFPFNIASVITQHLKLHQSSLNILREPRALVSICYWYAILPKPIVNLVCTQVHCMKPFATRKDEKSWRMGREWGVLSWGRRWGKEGERRGENTGEKKQRKKGSFLSYWYPVILLFFSSCPVKPLSFHNLNSSFSTGLMSIHYTNCVFLFFTEAINTTICERQFPYNSSHEICHGYQVEADTLHSMAWSDVNEVGENFETHFNRCKNKAFISQITRSCKLLLYNDPGGFITCSFLI